MQRWLQMLGSALLLMPLGSEAQQIYPGLPDSIDPDGRYVFYSHGAIVEGDDPRPRHPTFGVYDFPAIKDALFAGGGFNLIAEHRPAGVDFLVHVDRLESRVRALLAAGASPHRITLVGFSRGARLTAYAATRLNDTGINTAIMATCIDGDITGGPPVDLSGHVLSIYETSDVPGSCSALAGGSGIDDFQEVAISTGLSHGAFYRPDWQWLDPLKEWIARTNR